MIIFLITISVFGVAWLCAEAWTKPNMVAGKGTVTILCVCLALLAILVGVQ